MEERKDIEPYETICNNHNEIMHLLKEFKRTGDMWNIDQALKLVRYCKKQGQSLENRLYKWNDLVTRQMGYKRVYKPKKGKELKYWQKQG